MTVTTDGEEEAALTAYSYEKKVQVASFSNFFGFSDFVFGPSMPFEWRIKRQR